MLKLHLLSCFIFLFHTPIYEADFVIKECRHFVKHFYSIENSLSSKDILYVVA